MLHHTAEIVAVGTELLLGSIANTNAQYLSQELNALGIGVCYHTVVGDNPQRAREAVAIAKKRADIIITTGGLGPTCDDLTKNVLADAFGKKLVFHEESAQRIRAYFARTGRRMTDNNLQQAMLPEGCTVLDNDWGTAPGCAFEAEGVHVIMLPGPPSECRPMFYERAVPYLARFSEGVIASHTLKLFGIGESAMEAQLREQMNAMSNPTLAPYAKEGECELRVTAKAATMEQAQTLLLPAVEQLKGHFGPLVYGVDVASLEEVVFAEGRAVIRQAAVPWQHVRQIGEDVCAGEMLLPARTAVSPAAIGAMIAGGVLEVEVLARPVVGIIPTGDEVVPPTPDPAPGDVMEFNSAIFSAMLTQWGALPRTYPIVRDVEADIRAAFECRPDAVYVQLEIPDKAVVFASALAHERGIPFVVDAGPARTDFPLKELAGVCIFSPNETETKVFTGIAPVDESSRRAAAETLYRMVKTEYVVLKLGGAGAYLFDGTRGMTLPSYPIEVKDTTAAGDTFTAALVRFYLDGEPMEHAVRLANCAATIAVSRPGASASIPTLEETLAFAHKIGIG